YRIHDGALLRWQAYALLMFHISISAFSSVYNCSLYKKLSCSVHQGNMVLYAAGVAVNLLIHIFLSLTYYAEPGYFVGYDRLGTWMIILSGAVVSLAMTAVFK